MNIIVRFLFSCVFTLSAFGQYNLNGTVVNIEGTGIKDAKIQVQSSTKQIYTNTNGEFKISVDSNKVTLIISHINFQAQSISLELKTETSPLTVVLKEKEATLNEVIIHEKSIQSIFTKKNVTVIDYAINNDELIAIIKTQRDYQLLSFNFKGKVSQALPLSFKPLYIMHDCLDNFQILSKDSCYQIIGKYNSFTLLPTSFENYTTFLEPCVASTADYLFFKEISSYNQLITYYAFHKNEKTTQVILQIGDQVAIQLAQDYERGIAQNPTPGILHATIDNIEDVKDKMEDVLWFETQLTTEAYHPIFQIEDSLYIFNHAANNCTVHNAEGVNVRNFKIEYPNLEGWQKKLILDKESQRVYAISQQSGICSLHRLDLINGKVLKSYSISQHAFPTNVKVNNGYVYYLYKTKSSFYKLYRQPLIQ